MHQDGSTSPVAPQEQWCGIPGHPDYQVSDQGRVRSRARPGGWRVLRCGRFPDKPYRRVALKTPGGAYKHHMVHVLVLEAFVGPCPAGMQTRHLDGDGANNRLDNLRWGTPKENAEDQDRHGRRPRGERSHLAVIPDEAARPPGRCCPPVSSRALLRRPLGRPNRGRTS